MSQCGYLQYSPYLREAHAQYIPWCSVVIFSLSLPKSTL